LVFDEVYYAKYAQNYLDHIPLFDAHPPLGKYMIALGLWLSDRIPSEPTVVNGLTGVTRSPWSYRWMNAFAGSLVPLIVAGIAYQISWRWRYALIAGLLTTLDGFLLVESRYALINIYLVLFGLLGHWFFLIAIGQSTASKRWGWLTLAGVCLGASVAVKWNGLGFLLGLYGILTLAWINRWFRQQQGLPVFFPEDDSSTKPVTPLQNLLQIRILPLVVALGVVPALVYLLVWIPHLQINLVDLKTVHAQMANYHARMKDGPSVHLYCSRWYTWPWMIRPMSYFYEATRSLSDPLPPLRPPIPEDSRQVIYAVHAMGNPFLWWFSTLSLLLIIEMLIERLPTWVKGSSEMPLVPAHSWISLYLIVNYAANFLPWLVVSRCTFIYLYMGALVFGFLTLAYVVDQWLDTPQLGFRAASVTLIFVVICAFLYWLPIYWGYPLTPPDTFRWRMWFKSWI
jgi:dolichyl-phosphate-mannose-protein mannosyltransferase